MFVLQSPALSSACHSFSLVMLLSSGLAFDGSINMVVVEFGSHRVHVLRSADGSHVRVMGREGFDNGHFNHPFGGVIVRTALISSLVSVSKQFKMFEQVDKEGHMVVCDTLNHRVEVLR